MKYKEFLEYLEANLEGYQIFMSKAMQFQQEKNSARPAKKRWEIQKMEKAANDMWKKAMEPLYNNLKAEIKSDTISEWITYIQKNEIFESVNEGVSDLNFSDIVV